MPSLLDPTSLLATFGPLGVFVIMFAETGLLIGFFLPGDSSLFTAGVLAATSATSAVHVSLPVFIIAAAAGALIGAQTGFLIGRHAGEPLLRKTRNRHLRTGAERASKRLSRYGHPKAVVLAGSCPWCARRSTPSWEPPGRPADNSRSGRRWGAWPGRSKSPAGYALGASIPNIDTYLLPIIAVIVLLSLTPLLVELVRSRHVRRGTR